MKELNSQKIQNKLRNKFLNSGVKMAGPETIFFSNDTVKGSLLKIWNLNNQFNKKTRLLTGFSYCYIVNILFDAVHHSFQPGRKYKQDYCNNCRLNGN